LCKQPRKQKVSEPKPERAFRTEEPQQISIQDPTPGLLFGTGHLHDTHALVEALVDNFPHTAGPASTARIARILIQNAVGQKNDVLAAAILDIWQHG
jgi:hypothetical protein